MSKVNVEEKVRDLVAELFEIKRDEINLDSRFVEDLGADSLENVEMIMALDEAFGLEIPDEDAEKLLTVREAVEYIQKNIA